ncbi:glycosyltransferase involved in cell wall biosynthesis [Spirosoma lacussanchae]|uniref:glycosyltransferase n=1 Tax=Spirosoma lacussanchae TaxID=1884249 RepID=UPI001109BB7E|nr:glycosyltransferase [Spirosoma lacussanchae]
MTPSLLIFIDHFRPGYRFGGPIPAVENLISLLRDQYDLFVVTRDRDAGDTVAYPGLAAENWLHRDGYQVLYLPPDQVTFCRVGQLLSERPEALVYTNSLFSVFTRLLLLNSLLLKRPITVAPRGELLPGAIRLKAWKKQPYVQLLRWLMTDRLRWHATSIHEKEEIQYWLGVGADQIVLAPDLPIRLSPRPPHYKQAKQLRLIWLARIARNKGLLFLLDCLERVPEGVTLTIYGPVVDERYWQACLQRICASRHRIVYRGDVVPTAVRDTLVPYDFLVMPTSGENFGHGIAEALSVGLPVLISDQTPWQRLYEQRAGWNLPLHTDRWVDVLTSCLDMGPIAYTERAIGARAVLDRIFDQSAALAQYQQLFSPVSAPL